MPKLGEINYLKAIGGERVVHALHKPFSDAACSRYLADIAGRLEFLPSTDASALITRYTELVKSLQKLIDSFDAGG